ncbi:MAG: potassium transporter Kup [Dokdonella sp.]|jgi:KUP system potassium uptake protein|uniref:potassium transporter Kup n=1 Tax=Dokdonella sp. TaxID=2291710 RepID=UPI001B57EEE6|nr:potassium transporter Kup [Dokdonella sp.]MCC6439848.1 potassium transporter Kup [Rhodanobacteraceae bacterium]MBK8124721.1 potassium transporter Kup [Dokdonella sp.]MBP6329821.1 potassium transporter Kup [Dokdonella sp.]HQV50049.1 potassium transporter Kup [Dokdonella sp.]HQX34103.1 potassium transporter Kup [Dokdonella sp.]
MSESMASEKANHKRLLALSFLAIGVVFGDIGTSPLYAFREAFGQHGVEPLRENVLGVLSLIFWSLITVVSIKYATFILRADNKGEGGVMALMALAQRGVRRLRARWVVMVIGLFGSSLFFGDAVVTPAISVLSAVEGIEVLSPASTHYVAPITVLILLGIFSIQKHGSSRIGPLFAPITLTWFISLGVLGVSGIVREPGVLEALVPHHAFMFFVHNGKLGIFAMGAVVLSITGAEALYSDMGHFGKTPIRLVWFVVVLPCLMLNYLGQGALVLADSTTASNPFYLLVPADFLIPMIVLATMATVVASQAVIAGTFSMARQAIQLGYLPRMQVLHTSSQQEGQIFLPWINRTLLLLTVAVVLGFKSSSNLVSAYGLAVVGTMLLNTILVVIVARRIWGWSHLRVATAGLVFLGVDLLLLTAVADKFIYGGWFPLALGVLVFTVMITWRRGRDLVMREIKRAGLALEPFIASISAHPPLRVPGTAVFLTANPEGVPNALLHNLKHNKVLHERNVMLTVEILDEPVTDPTTRVSVAPLADGFYLVSVRYGFSEDPDIPAALLGVSQCGFPFDMMDTTFFLSRESIVAGDRPGMTLWRDRLFQILSRNATSATAFFRIPGNRLIELGTQVEI